MRYWLQKVMMGRYGVDEINRRLHTTALIALVQTILYKGLLTTVYSLIAITALVYSYIRMFSRNTYKRRAENNAYLTLRYNMTRKLSGLKQRMQQK